MKVWEIFYGLYSTPTCNFNKKEAFIYSCEFNGF